MNLQLDLAGIFEQLVNFWPLLASVMGLVIGVILLRFTRRAVRSALSWMRERLNYHVS